MNGFLLIDKNKDMTSTYVDNQIKHSLHVSKIGHLGTLDPFAIGLLVLAIGEATKTLPLIAEGKKEYIATLKLGSETDTLDPTGNVIVNKPVKKFSNDEIIEVLNSFLGPSKQTPPNFSAKWVNGTRAYDLARENKRFKLSEIDISIYEISLLKYDSEDDVIVFKALVSKGTYIRVLGSDIAKKLNTVGHLLDLRRTKIGSYDVKNAKKIDEVTESDIISIENFLPEIKTYELNDAQYLKAKNGNELYLAITDDYVFLKYREQLLSIYYKKDKKYLSYRGFKHE